MKHSDIFNNLSNKQAVTSLELGLCGKNNKNIIHEINNVVVFRFVDEFGVFNRVTKVYSFFDTYEDAINRVLDFYGDTITREQLKIKL